MIAHAMLYATSVDSAVSHTTHAGAALPATWEAMQSGDLSKLKDGGPFDRHLP